MSPTPEVLYPKLNSALSLLISLRYFQLNITIKPFTKGQNYCWEYIRRPNDHSDKWVFANWESLPTSSVGRKQDMDSKRRCSYLLENHDPIQSNSIHFCCLERKNLLSVGSQHGTLLQVHTLPCMHITQPWCHGWNLDHIWTLTLTWSIS